MITCPRCGGRGMAKSLAKYGACGKCRERAAHADEELTGKAKERVLAEFATWLDTTAGPWDRATQGLRMFVPADDRIAFWP